MDTFGVYGHEMQGDTSLTAQMIQDRFDDLLSNSKNHHQTTFKQCFGVKENPQQIASSYGLLRVRFGARDGNRTKLGL